MKKRPIWVVFQGASDGNAPGPRNISQKSKDDEKLNFRKKSNFSKIQFFVIFVLLAYISACFDITIRRAMKKDAY